jgi:hypothetical protein
VKDWMAVILKIGGVIVVVLSFFIPQVKDFAVKRYQLSLDEALEDKKSSNNRKGYIRKATFNEEIVIYRELSEKVTNMVFNFAELVRTIDQGDDKEMMEKVLKTAADSYNEANRATRKYGPFMDEDIYEVFTKLGDKCRKQLNYFSEYYHENLPLSRFLETLEIQYPYRRESISDSSSGPDIKQMIRSNHQDISNSLDDLRQRLRIYLSSM